MIKSLATNSEANLVENTENSSFLLVRALTVKLEDINGWKIDSIALMEAGDI